MKSKSNTAQSLAHWIWYPGEFEIYHSLMLHGRREDVGRQYPGFWKLDNWYPNIVFTCTYHLDAPETVETYVNGIGYIAVNGVKHPLGKPVTLGTGKQHLYVSVMNTASLPALLLRGTTVNSGDGWKTSRYDETELPAAHYTGYDDPDSPPDVFRFSYQEVLPVSTAGYGDGFLYDFGRETFARLRITEKPSDVRLGVYYGESIEEATDTAFTIIQDSVPAGQTDCEMPARAFRYIYLTGIQSPCRLVADYEYIPFTYRGAFQSSDDQLNRIWDTAAYTFHLNSREFFLDGIKRDRWVWSGDAYQSYLVNYYLFFDNDICRRTMLALRGKDPVERHLNTIMDYSFYWIIALEDYHFHTGDTAFLEAIYAKAESLMAFCLSRLDADGLATGYSLDWVFVDWADMDKTGAVCAEQMLLARAIESMARISALTGHDGATYNRHAKALIEKINTLFWDEEKGCFIDSFTSGKRNVTRHANIFALQFDYITPARRDSILRHVIFNDAVPPITTPYFKFFELDALCRLGALPQVLESMRAYWGGMLDLGATSIWEEFDPAQEGAQHYDMYGQKYGKSLCHAWGASPVYVLGRYFAGVRPTSPGYETFEVVPQRVGLDWFSCTVPTPRGDISIRCDADGVCVRAAFAGGTLRVHDTSYVIPADRELTVAAAPAR